MDTKRANEKQRDFLRWVLDNPNTLDEGECEILEGTIKGKWYYADGNVQKFLNELRTVNEEEYKNSKWKWH